MSCLGAGIVGSLVYVAADVVAAIRYPDYHSFTARFVSELMARGAPTERLVDPLFLAYGLLMIAFGAGVWMSASTRRTRAVGAILVAFAALGELGPTLCEMDVRHTGAATNADVAHIALTTVMVVLTVLSVALAATTRGRGFRYYSYATLAIMIGFGALTSLATRGMEVGAPTPWVGLYERIDIAAFMVWIAVYAIALLRESRTRETRNVCDGDPIARTDRAIGSI